MATMLLRVEGTSEVIQPAGPRWSLEELQTLVGGWIEVCPTVDGRFLVIDEEGKLFKKPLNIQATKLYLHGRHDPIVGTAILVDTKEEFNEPEVDDDEEQSEVDDVCFAKLDACTNVYGDDPPRAGDFTVCIDCGGILRYDDAMNLIVSSLAESPIQIRSQLAGLSMLSQEVKRNIKRAKPWEM